MNTASKQAKKPVKKLAAKAPKKKGAGGGKGGKGGKGVQPMSAERLERLNKERAEKNLPPLTEGTQLAVSGQQEPPVIIASDRPANEIVQDRVKLNAAANAATIDKGTTPEEMASIIGYFYHLNESSGFILGDAINFAQENFGAHVYKGIAKATGRPEKTLYNFASVAAAIPADSRNPQLTYTHHAAVAYVKDTDKRKQLLKEAAEKNLNVRELKDKAKRHLPGKKGKKGTGTSGGGTGTPPASGGTGTGATPASTTPPKALSEQEQILQDDAIEAGDTVLTFTKGKVWPKLPLKDKKAWLALLKQLAMVHEALEKELA